MSDQGESGSLECFRNVVQRLGHTSRMFDNAERSQGSSLATLIDEYLGRKWSELLQCAREKDLPVMMA